MSVTDRIKSARDELATARAELLRSLDNDRTRRRGSLVRQLHEVQRMLDPEFPYVSQAGQDTVIDRLLGGKRGGTFVDIGGYDGTSGSNTFFFEVWRNWTGVLVEPVATQLGKARAVRRCPCLGYAVAPGKGEATFLEVTKGFTQMSGLVDSYDPVLLGKVRDDPRHAEVTVTVQTRTLSDILIEADLPHPDFVSLDIEGGEMAVLQGFAFADHQVGFWAIENNAGTGDIARLMRANGYDLVEFCGPDEIYRRRVA
jgi:FkbM family methyltransferase